ncbi:FAD-binding oxidoreductase [Streptomyces sp. NBC_00878]|uniref:FAD-binding oxidoreductase n=1 Tax=Streptomyces sp. NBC_00878 TaxID=2975854 RepID=UPI00225317BD|nr:FAD-binding oxidoreductase [Streptomyces sp. NBC_00878]MCX4903966.1 FAD-binding oxidoreductase [Streptomyces sp. NBC_00878]
MTEYLRRSCLEADDIAELAKRIGGSVFAPDDAGYAEAVAAFNLRSQHRPWLVVAAATTADVQAAVGFATAHGMPVGVMATGHQPFPVTEGFLLITTGALSTVEIDAERAVARVGAGARWKDVVEPAQAAGLAPLHGSAPDVGVVGFTLGGGQSPFLGRTYGWAADHVNSIEVVTADGALRRVSAECEPELFWGLRGGRSNFGVVTELEIGLFPVTSFYGGGLYYPAEDIEAVIRAYFEVVRDAPDALTCSLAVLNFPPVPEVPEPMRGKSFAHVRVTHLGSDDEAEKLILPFRDIGSAVVDTVGRHPYVEFAAVHTDPTDRFPYEEQGITVTDLPAEAIDVIVRDARRAAGSPVTALEIRHLGGALARRPGEAAPVAVREAVFSVWGVTAGPPEVVNAGMAVLDDMLRNLTPWSTGYVYTNFAGRDDRAEDVFTAADLQRLRTLKQFYDPHNLFRANNHNITPE